MKTTDQALRTSIENIDCASQQHFSEIISIARLAQFRLKSPGDLDAISGALELIGRIARDGENLINVMAENVGCNFTSEREVEVQQ